MLLDGASATTKPEMRLIKEAPVARSTRVNDHKRIGGQQETHFQILLSSSRCVSNFFRGTVALMGRGKLVENTPRELSHRFLSNVEPCAVAAYLRKGGSAVERRQAGIWQN